MLYKFSLKYEGGMGMSNWSPPEKLPSKKPSLIRLKAVFYKKFFKWTRFALVDGYYYWGKLGTISVTYSTGIISPMYIKMW